MTDQFTSTSADDDDAENPIENDAVVNGELVNSTDPVLEQRIVPFMGDTLLAARTEQGAIFISVPGICTALGLNDTAQIRRMRRSRVLLRGLRQIPLATPGGAQVTNCLRVDLLALWLAGIETERIRPQFQAKIEAYQEELAPIALQVFCGAWV